MSAVAAAPLACGEALGPAEAARLRRRMIFEWNKWDPQSGDHGALAAFPLVLSADAWRELATAAEALYAEALAAEAELAARPELHARLGLPRDVRAALRVAAAQPPTQGPRFIRFDFHLTLEGWRISEGNTDVPGGLLEAAGLAALHAELGSAPGVAPPAPGPALAQALHSRLAPGAAVALLHASAFTDDRQSMLYLTRELARAGLEGLAIAPDALRWSGGRARAAIAGGERDVDAVFRFYPAEWLPSLPRACGWPSLFGGALVPQSNPPSALLTQSKRFPLVWDALRTALPTWRRLLPETCEVSAARRRDPAWVLKPAMGRVGEDVLVHGVSSAADQRRIGRWAAWLPWRWAAQRRFESAGVDSPMGVVHPSIGVFVVEGAAAGLYGRFATRPLVDQSARECAVFIEDASAGGAATLAYASGSGS